MSKLSAILAAVLLCLAVAPGCAARRCPAGVDCFPLSGPAELAVAAGQPEQNLVDVSDALLLETVDRLLGRTVEPQSYRILKADDCQCLAAQNAALGSVLSVESQLSLQTQTDKHGRVASPARLQARLLAMRAVEERNRAAGAALECFYRLAEAQAGRIILDRSIKEIDGAIADYESVKGRGLSVSTDDGALRRQRLDLLARDAQLQASTDTLRGHLCHLLNLPFADGTPVWASADLEISLIPIDAEAAVNEGFANRTDIGMLCVLREGLTAENLPAIQSAMKRLEPLAGASPVGCRLLAALLGESNDTCELQTRCSQIEELLSERYRAAEQEIREAVGLVEQELRETALAKEKLESWQQQVKRLREKRETGGANSFEIRAAGLELLSAESDVVRHVVAWRVAQAKLKQAQGLLPGECGLDVESN